MELILSSWLYLLIAILFGVFGTVSMKLSSGLQNLKPTAALFVFYLISLAALTLALQGIDMSIVYAIWSGVGTVLIVIISYFVFNESMSIKKIVSLLFVVTGVFGIHLANAFHSIH
jgi:small multidrug resistance pump